MWAAAAPASPEHRDLYLDRKRDRVQFMHLAGQIQHFKKGKICIFMYANKKMNLFTKFFFYQIFLFPFQLLNFGALKIRV